MRKKSTSSGNAGEFIDEYIRELPEVTREICTKLRAIIRNAEPNITEGWNYVPNFLFKKDKICAFAASKEWVSFGFFNGIQLKDKWKILTEGSNSLSSRYCKIQDPKEIKEKILLEYIREAVKLTENKKVPAGNKVIIPAYFKQALQNAGLMNKFEKATAVYREAYIQWITDAKKDDIRKYRIEKALKKIRHGEKLS